MQYYSVAKMYSNKIDLLSKYITNKVIRYTNMD